VINRQGIASCECGPECEPVMRPVCARGGTTYMSMCELKRQACLIRSNIEVAYTGTCGSRGPCSEKVSLIRTIRSVSCTGDARAERKSHGTCSRFPLPLLLADRSLITANYCTSGNVSVLDGCLPHSSSVLWHISLNSTGRLHARRTQLTCCDIVATRDSDS